MARSFDPDIRSVIDQVSKLAALPLEQTCFAIPKGGEFENQENNAFALNDESFTEQFQALGKTDADAAETEGTFLGEPPAPPLMETAIRQQETLLEPVNAGTPSSEPRLTFEIRGNSRVEVHYELDEEAIDLICSGNELRIVKEDGTSIHIPFGNKKPN